MRAFIHCFTGCKKGSAIEVEGYRWTARLWRESAEVVLPAALRDEAHAREAYLRPVRVSQLGKEAVPLVKGGPAVVDIPRDFTALFAANWDWMAAALGIGIGGNRDAEN